ncbi:MAG: CHAT domain-containing protein [Pseudomonadota bacterium]
MRVLIVSLVVLIGVSSCSGGAAPGRAASSPAQTAPTASSRAVVAVAVADACVEPALPSSSEPVARTDDDRALLRAYDSYAHARHEEALGLLEPVLAKQLASANPASALPGLRLRAMLAVARGRVPEAVSDLRRSLEISEAWISAARASLTEAQMATAVAYLRVDEELVYSLAAEHPADPEVAQLALIFATLRKGRLAGEVTKTFGEFTRAASATAGLRQFREVRSEYASAALLGARPAELSRLEQQSEQLERTLLGSTTIGQLATGTMDLSVAPSLVLGQLGSAATMGNVLLDFEEFRRYRFGDARHSGAFGASEYLALLLADGDRIHVVSLGAANTIDAATRRVVKAFAARETGYEALARDLYTRVFAPLELHLQSDIGYVDRLIYVSPDGQLGLVPFAALMGRDGPLLDRFRLSYLDTPRDLWGPRRGLHDATSVHVLAAPDFSQTLPKASAEGKDCGSLKLSAIPPLPGTAEEAALLKGLMPLAQVKVGAASTRAELLSLTSPGILHVATHGVFMDSSPATEASRGLLLETPTEPPPQGVEGLRRDPLVRSALLLAGAPDGTAGGLVTALEIGAMNLEGTQLVVLSACDTGRGDIHVGQGVYGLRRAFMLAGAHTVVTSLWKVDDAATRELMSLYYQALLHGEGKADAMRNAAVTLRKEHPHPYFWAPFIVSGAIDRLSGADGQAIPRIEPPRHGLSVQPVHPSEPIIIGPH